MNNQDQIENADDSDELKNNFDSDSLDMNVSSNVLKKMSFVLDKISLKCMKNEFIFIVDSWDERRDGVDKERSKFGSWSR